MSRADGRRSRLQNLVACERDLGKHWRVSKTNSNQMKKSTLLLACILSLAVTGLRAADAKSYQVTGPVLEVTPAYVVIQKGDEKWQVACDAATLGGAKVGDKVTIQYTVVAKKVEVKTDKGEKSEKKMDKAEKRAEKKADKK